MTIQVHTELFTVSPNQTDYQVGQFVEVIYTSPTTERRPYYSRVMQFLGTVAARPEDKTNQLVYSERRGDIEILDIPVAPTYTIRTLAQTLIESEELPCGTLQLERTPYSPADLIFDPSNVLYDINPVGASAPIEL